MIPIPPPFDEDNQEALRISDTTETIHEMRKAFSAIKMRCAVAACEQPSWSQTCFAEITKLCEDALRTNDSLADGEWPATPATQEPTSDPEGAATQDQIGILSCDNHRMRKFGTLLAEAALYVIREYDGTHRLSLAVSAWAKAIGDEGGRGLLDTTPSPTLEKLAQEIDDLYEAPSRIRPLRRILEREFGASQSVAEAARAVMVIALSPGKNWDESLTEIKHIFAAREHELRELREECERLRKDLSQYGGHAFGCRSRRFAGYTGSGVPVHYDCNCGWPSIDAAMQPGAQRK